MELAISTTTTSGTRANVFLNTFGSGSEFKGTIDVSDLDSSEAAPFIAAGYLPQGFPLAKVTSSGLFVEYDPADPAPTDGSQTVAGLLRWDVPISSATAVTSVSITREAHVIEANLPIEIDAAGKADLPHALFA